ncbi:MAG TPA: OB-fold domain-containing protein [Candidatus Binataceae bacterium]|nr:OB-fold domain-containing protein [Candidatus Binataceae bacterium]
MAAASNFPSPIPDLEAEEYWAGCNRGELLMQRCAQCKKFRWLPRPMCPACNSLEREWVKVSGRGVVYSYTIITHPVHPAAIDRVPYNVTQVQLDEDPELILVTTMVGVRNEDIRIGMRVVVTFEEHEPGVKLAKFKPT